MSNIATGLIGHPVKHSLSPQIHRYWMAQYGIKGDYELWDTPPEQLGETMRKLRDVGVRGFNSTVPHKQALMEFLDEIDETALRIGAVNTVLNRSGKLIGINTDSYGFITNLKEGLGNLEPYLEQVVVLGAGGAARAVLVSLKDAGAKRVTIINRTIQIAQALAKEFNCETAHWSVDNKMPIGTTLLINTTVLGMQGKDPLTIDISNLADHAAVHDIVYAPLQTRLLEEASEQGFATVDGLGMLLYQAQKAFAMWHGVEPKVTGALRAHVIEKIA
ncbi:MAG: shikimate dehydrogenase [Rickettsiales bacterium]